jgi:hypothetical protein
MKPGVAFLMGKEGKDQRRRRETRSPPRARRDAEPGAGLAAPTMRKTRNSP